MKQSFLKESNPIVEILKSTKGYGLYSKKTLKKGETIAYYKIRVFKLKDYVSPTDFVYSFEVYRKNGNKYRRFIGDIDSKSFPPFKDGISYWAPFANEPSKDEKTNADIEIDLKENYLGRTFLKPGDYVVYRLVATKTISPGDEILWYYGDDYERNYEVGK